MKTSAVMPQFFCAIFRHCAVVIDETLIQIGTDGVRLFKCGPRQIAMLESAGWVFLQCAIDNEQLTIGHGRLQILTCVGFAKRAIGIRAPFIWTPDQLFRFLSCRFTA